MFDLKVWAEFSSSTYNILATKRFKVPFVPSRGGYVYIDGTECVLAKEPGIDLDFGFATIELEIKIRGISPHQDFLLYLSENDWKVVDDLTERGRQ